MVISKDNATKIAVELCKQKKANADELFKSFQEEVYGYYIGQMPEEIKSAYKKHPDWFSTDSCVLLNGSGFSWKRVSVIPRVVKNGGGNATLNLTPKITASLQKANNLQKKAYDDYHALVEEVKTALLSLKTFTRITERFPEAAALLPKSTSTALIVNIDGIRKKLK